MAQYVITHPQDGVYAWNSPMEGWVWTPLVEPATRFDSKEDAFKVIRDVFACNRELAVQAVEKPLPEAIPPSAINYRRKGQKLRHEL